MSSIFNPSRGKQAENDNKRLYRNVTMLKLLRADLVFFGLLLAAALLVILYAVAVLTDESEAFPAWLIAGMAGVLAGVLGLVLTVALQEKANALFRNLLVVWNYSGLFLSRFYKMAMRRRKATASLHLCLGALVCGVLGLVFLLLQPQIAAMYLLLFAAAGVLLVLAFLFHPVWGMVFNRLLCLLFGKKQQILLARTGLWMNGRFVTFGMNITLYKVELCDIGSFRCLVFFLQSRRGYQQEAREITVPAPPSASPEELQELLEIYNSPDLLAGPEAVPGV